MGVMKMGYIVPRVGLEPTSLAFWASVLPFYHVGSLMLPLYPRPPVYVAPCLRVMVRPGLARNARDVGLSPALSTIFPIFVTPTTVSYLKNYKAIKILLLQN